MRKHDKDLRVEEEKRRRKEDSLDPSGRPQILTRKEKKEAAKAKKAQEKADAKAGKPEKKKAGPKEKTPEKEPPKKDRIYSPMKMSKMLKEIGESYTKTQVFIGYVGLFALAMLMGALFKLPIPMMLAVGVFYLLLAPKFLYNMKKRAYEKKRYTDANSYIAQMAQSFTSTGNILASLQETEATFTAGRMKTTLRKAIAKIRNAESNVRQVTIDALEDIARNYDCDKTRNLNDFLIRAESRGGDCTAEFTILEKTRYAWADAVRKFHAKLVLSKAVITIEFVALLGVLMFFLRRFPDNISLIDNPVVQVVNAIEIAAFLVVYLVMDSKLNVSLLRDSEFMPVETVEKNHEFIRSFNYKAQLKKTAIIIVIAMVIGVLAIVFKPSALTVLIAGALIVAAFCIPKIRMMVTMLSMKMEMERAFPKWLFDIMLLMQTESVEASLFHSQEFAPPVLVPELRQMCESLSEKPGNPDAYMSFLATYNIEGVEDTMRKLYSLNVGTGDKAIMDVIIESNMTILTEAEAESLNSRGDLSSLNSFIPIGCIAAGIIAYFAVLMFDIFTMLSGMINSY